MPALRRFDVDELLTRPGTYFNPQTEIVVVVDDSAHVDLELLDDDADDDAAEWILLSDDVVPLAGDDDEAGAAGDVGHRPGEHRGCCAPGARAAGAPTGR